MGVRPTPQNGPPAGDSHDPAGACRGSRMIMFGVGLFVGFALGVVVLACCHVAQRADAGAVKEHLCKQPATEVAGFIGGRDDAYPRH